jgi:hypothetical protein
MDTPHLQMIAAGILTANGLAPFRTTNASNGTLRIAAQRDTSEPGQPDSSVPERNDLIANALLHDGFRVARRTPGAAVYAYPDPEDEITNGMLCDTPGHLGDPEMWIAVLPTRHHLDFTHACLTCVNASKSSM